MQKDDPVDVRVVEDEKENEQPNMGERGPQMDPPPQPLSQRSTTKDVRDCPQTPLGRIPLSELLASGEDTRQHLNLTPIERVLWDNSPLDSGPLNSLPARKRRKRAHSSSPTSSSQNEASVHFPREKKAVSTQALQKPLSTPKADPADDLWTRYSLNIGERRSPTAPADIEFANLMHSSSPQTPASHVQKDSGGLRRALSCVEWPTSAAKRRKLFHYSSQRNSATDVSNINGRSAERSRMSKVSLLVEKIHDGLAKPAAPHQSDSSSEPARCSPISHNGDSSSPIAEENISLGRGNEGAIDDVANVLSQTAVAPQKCAYEPLLLSDEEIKDLGKDDSSDFGDDDLDIEMMESNNPAFKTPRKVSNVANRLHQGDAQSDDGLASEVKENSATIANDGEYSNVYLPTGMSSSAVKGLLQKRDEFDEDENDIFAADLEDICAKYDSQVQPDAKVEQTPQVDANANKGPSTTHSAQEKISMPIEIEVISDDDDFGDDSDFEQIAAECAEVTQRQQVSQPQSSVRTWNVGSYI